MSQQKCVEVPTSAQEVATGMGLTKVGSQYCGPIGFKKNSRVGAMICMPESSFNQKQMTKYCLKNRTDGQSCFFGGKAEAKSACESSDDPDGYDLSYTGRFLRYND